MHKPSRGAILCGLVPFIAMCFSVSLWDQIYPFVFGMPFNMFWLTGWVLLTPLIMWRAYKFEMAKLAENKVQEGMKDE